MFFFSSRRRHTRLQGDWSSDVCSSDLTASNRTTLNTPAISRKLPYTKRNAPRMALRTPTSSTAMTKIGRASCRERGEVSEGDVAVKKKTIERERAEGEKASERTRAWRE